MWEKKNVTHDHNKTLVLGLMPFSHHAYLYELAMFGKFEKLLKQLEFYPPNLLKLELWKCELRDDPMMILKKLPSLQILRLCYRAYVGKKMVCSSERFLQLERLELYELRELGELMIYKGAMSSLKNLKIQYCGEMKKLYH